MGCFLALIAFGWGCGGSDGDGGGTSSAEDLRVTYSLYDRTAAYFRGCAAGIEAAADEAGVDLDVQLSGIDPTRQIQQIETAITQQTDALIVTPIDTDALTPVTEKAIEAGIPVFGVCDDIGSNGRTVGPTRVSQVVPDQISIGRQKAEFVVEALNGEGKVGRFYGVRGVPFDRYTRAGEEPVFANEPGIEFIEGPYAGEYSTDAGLTVSENLLTANPDLDAIVCDNDDLCLGTVRALKEREISFDDIVLVSNDGIEPAIKAVQKGEIDYTLAFCGFNMGELVMNHAIDLMVDGKAPPQLTVDTGREVTRENADQAEPVEERCSDPAIQVAVEEPNTQLLDELGISTH